MNQEIGSQYSKDNIEDTTGFRAKARPHQLYEEFMKKVYLPATK